MGRFCDPRYYKAAPIMAALWTGRLMSADTLGGCRYEMWTQSVLVNCWSISPFYEADLPSSVAITVESCMLLRC